MILNEPTLFLQKIIETKREEVGRTPTYSPAAYQGIGLKESLLSKRPSFITECKKASPSAGVIREPFHPAEIAKVYEACGASGVSVLTDEKFFQGSLRDLEEVSKSISIPVLRKDFIIDTKQILEARQFGAAAVLLIVRILDAYQLRDFLATAREFGMDCLVETHSAREADLAVECGASIVGVNTRDLDTFEIKPELISEICDHLPPDIIRVGESGVKKASDIAGMLQYVQSLLIGTYFMKSSDISKSFQELWEVAKLHAPKV